MVLTNGIFYRLNFFGSKNISLSNCSLTEHLLESGLNWIYKWGSLKLTGLVDFFRIAVLSISTPKENAMAK
jgi:hypothetical protein